MLQPSVLRRRAGDLLQNAAYAPKKLVLIHTAVSAGSLFLVSIINYLLSLQIAQTGGLGGIGLRTVLTTVQSVLDLVVTLALPFWELGLVFAALRWARDETPTPTDLLEGFRRFGPVMRLRCLQFLLLIVVTIGVFNISYIIFVMTPFADPLISQLEEVIAQSGGAVQPEMLITEELLAAAAECCVPLFIIFGILCAVVTIPLFYRLRFADFSLMEGSGALKALLDSLRITKRNCLQVAKLDLSFWWFYLLQILSIAIGYSDLLLSAVGVHIPVAADVRMLIFSGLSLLAQTVVVWQYQGSVLTCYGLCYQSLCAPTSVPQPASTPIEM